MHRSFLYAFSCYNVIFCVCNIKVAVKSFLLMSLFWLQYVLTSQALIFKITSCVNLISDNTTAYILNSNKTVGILNYHGRASTLLTLSIIFLGSER